MTVDTRRRLLSFGLIALGLATSGYLLLRYFALHANPALQGTGFCSIVLKMDCDASLLSNMSKQLGIPVAGWGVVYYVTLASLLILGHLLGESFDSEARLSALILAGTGGGGSIALAAIIAAGLAPFCPLCMAIHAVNVVLVVALWRFSGRTARQFVRGLAAGGAYLIGRSNGTGPQTKWTCVGLLTTALIAVALYQCILFQTEMQAPAKPSFDARQVLIDYAFMPEAEIPVDARDPYVGDGPVQVVMFSSFECPACRVVTRYLHQLSESYPGKLRIVFKHFPLGQACNARLEKEIYPHACAAAWAAEAAKHEGAFWTFHDGLLTADFAEPNDPIAQVACETGLPRRRFEALCEADVVRKKVQEDIALGNRLGVVGTPTLFINGRKVLHLDLWALDLLLTAITDFPQIELDDFDPAHIRRMAASE